MKEDSKLSDYDNILVADENGIVIFDDLHPQTSLSLEMQKYFAL